MKAFRLTRWQHDGTLEDVPQPDPRPGQVLVRIGGAGACHSDLHLMHDFAPGLLPWGPPFTLGHENAGWVEAVGTGVTGLDVGQPVAVYGPWGCGRCARCAAGAENYCERQAEIGPAGGGLGLDGGMAPFMLVPDARLLVPLDDLDPVDAAPLTDAGLTPYHAIKRSLHKLGAGSSAVVIGAGGGLGHMAVQLLAALSAATVIAVDQNLTGLQRARHLGAAHAVFSADGAETVREHLHGRGCDLALDLVGSDATLALAAACVRPEGDLTIVGIAGGTLPVSFFGLPYEVSVTTTYWGSRPELHEVLSLAARKQIHASVQRFTLDDAASAYTAMRDGSLHGRAVVVP